MGDPVTLSLLAVTAYSTYQQGEAQREQKEQTQKQYAAEQRRTEIQNIRNTRQQIREARLRQSSMTNIAAQTGGVGGSAVAGGVSSVGSQLASNVNYIGEIAAQNTAYSQAGMQVASAAGDAAMWGGIGKISGTIFEGYTGMTPGRYIGRQLR